MTVSFFRYFVCCRCCVPVSHRKLLTLWQPRYNSSSRTSRSSFCDNYERAFLCACVRIMCARHPEHNEGQLQHTFPLNSRASRKDWIIPTLFLQYNRGVSYNSTLFCTRRPMKLYHGYTRTTAAACTCTYCLLVRVRTKAACCQILPPSMTALWFPCT